ncbi:MAG TPA: RNA methyltransferase [Bacteroidia bacterium]|nr:RNA methyltransferase [Bacteroidia bacterium]
MKILKNEELNRPGIRTYQSLEKMNLTVVLDNVRSGMNIGSVFRSADSFLVEQLVLCGISACPPDREILKTALGATESVTWSYFDSTYAALKELKEKGYRIWAVEQCQNSIPLNSISVTDSPVALVFGHEVKGVDPALAPLIDGCIEVPQSGTKHSLNIAVCAGIVLWEFYKNKVLENS